MNNIVTLTYFKKVAWTAHFAVATLIVLLLATHRQHVLEFTAAMIIFGLAKEAYDYTRGKDDLEYAILDALTYTLGAITGGLLSLWR